MVERMEIVKRIPGGKTLKVEVELEKGIIKKVVFSGDFFAYPPEVFEELEESLRYTRIEEIEEKIRKYHGKIALLGLSLEDIISTLKELLELS
ncbi:MAG: hypothetical protein DRJ38_05095 [Thermoprotei archaeon]|nr:MAG: hypothetical protein DRJ38_05095 [Thermoprotei archaeon]